MPDIYKASLRQVCAVSMAFMNLIRPQSAQMCNVNGPGVEQPKAKSLNCLLLITIMSF